MKRSKKPLTTDMIKTITQYPSSFDSGQLRRAVADAHEHYKSDVPGCTFEWYEQVRNACNAALSARFEETV